MKVSKNNVSYFTSGFYAALMIRGMDKKIVDDLDYKTIEIPNMIRELLRVYEREETDTDGLESMTTHIRENFSELEDNFHSSLLKLMKKYK